MHVLLLPEWLRLTGVFAFAGVTAVHLQHAVMASGTRRFWHAGHTLMAAGMISMFLPAQFRFPPPLVWTVIYALAGSALVLWMVLMLLRRQAVGLFWPDLLIGILTMFYMFALRPATIIPLTVVLATYFVADAVGWATGWLYNTQEVSMSGLQFGRRASPSTQRAILVRITLATMAAGMAYMLVAMS